MATLSARPEWSGIIRFGDDKLDCSLYSAQAKEDGLITIHIVCENPLSKQKDGASKKGDPSEDEEGEGDEIEAALPRLLHGPYCPTCDRTVASNEVGYAMQTPDGLKTLSEKELFALSPLPRKEVEAASVTASQPIMRALGFGRRLYVFPKPGSLELFATIYRAMRITRTVGFIPHMVIKKKAYAGIIRPMVYPAQFFGEPQELMVFEAVGDTSLLKDPRALRGYYGNLPEPSKRALGKHIEWFRNHRTPLDVKELIEPRRAALRKISTNRQKEMFEPQAGD